MTFLLKKLKLTDLKLEFVIFVKKSHISKIFQCSKNCCIPKNQLFIKKWLFKTFVFLSLWKFWPRPREKIWNIWKKKPKIILFDSFFQFWSVASFIKKFKTINTTNRVYFKIIGQQSLCTLISNSSQHIFHHIWYQLTCTLYK